MSSTPDKGQGGDNIVEAKGSYGVDGFDMAAFDQDKELLEKTVMKVSNDKPQPRLSSRGDGKAV